MKLPWNPGKKIAYVVAGFLAVLLLAFACDSRAGPGVIEAGVGATVVRGTAPVFDLALVYPRAAPLDADFELGVTFIGESTYEGERQANNFAWRAMIVDGFGKFDMGLGIAYLQNTDTYNGSHLNFSLMLAYRFEKYRAKQLHFSNGGTRSPNKGRDMSLICRRFE